MRILGANFKNVRASSCLALPDAIANSGDQTHQREYHEVDDDVKVGLLFDLGPFGGGCTTVKHDLGVCASVDDKPNDPVRIPQSTATEQEFVDRDGFLLVLTICIGVAQDRLVGVEVLVRRLAIQDERETL